MADTIITVPFLIGDLPYTVNVLDPATLEAVESDIALTIDDGSHRGTVTGPHAGLFVFAVFADGEFVESRIRTIADDVGPYTIITGLDADRSVNLPGVLNPSTDDDFATGYTLVYDQFGQLEDGVDYTVQMTAGTGAAGMSLDTAARTTQSATVTIDGQEIVGYVEFAGLRRGATYAIWRGGAGGGNAGQRRTIIIPDLPAFALAETLGTE